MQRWLKRSAWLGVIVLLLAAPAWADSWAAPPLREVFSASRDFFVRIVPGDSLADTVGFAGSPRGRYARAEFYRRAPDRSYRFVAETSLLNPVAPVEVFVADSGHLVTLDNWHNLGYGKVVALYDAQGRSLRSYELKDLFLPDELARFPVSVSSVHWRSGPVYIRQDGTTLLVTVRSGADFLFGLESGRYKYCEPVQATFRCRDANAPRAWRDGNAVPEPR